MDLLCISCKESFAGDYLRCPSCAGPLEVKARSRSKINFGGAFGQSIMERYLDFFPLERVNEKISLGEGRTPLLSAEKLADLCGVGKLYLKNETKNPTWSFKDRGTAVGVQYAAAHGYKRIGTVSSGNMAASVAAYGARAGLETFIFVSMDIDDEKVAPIAIYGPQLFKVDGDYSKLYFEALKIGEEHGIFFINSDAPLRVEGSKSIAFEIAEQLGFDVPDYVVVPTSAGGNFRGITKGFLEFYQAGLIKKVPRMVCAQAAGCSPIYNAFAQGKKEVEHIGKPDTIAHAISNPCPPSGNVVLALLEQTGGLAVTVTDDEIIQAQKLLAEEGLFVQPDSAVSLAATLKLGQNGSIGRDQTVAGILTGSGLKYTKALELHKIKFHTSSLPEIGDYFRKNFN